MLAENERPARGRLTSDRAQAPPRSRTPLAADAAVGPSITAHPDTPERASRLSLAKRTLLHLIAEIEFGSISGFSVRDGDPILIPPPTITYDLRLKNSRGSERSQGDFELKGSVARLFSVFARVGSAHVARLEIQNKLPSRLIIEPDGNSLVAVRGGE